MAILDQSSPQDLVAKIMGQGIARNLPGGLQQATQRQMGLGAIDQLQNDLSGANGDISKILPALARAYTLNPNLERSGLGQQYLQQAKLGNAFGGQGQIGQNAQATTGMSNPSQPQQETSQPASTMEEVKDTNGIIP